MLIGGETMTAIETVGALLILAAAVVEARRSGNETLAVSAEAPNG